MRIDSVMQFRHTRGSDSLRQTDGPVHGSIYRRVVATMSANDNSECICAPSARVGAVARSHVAAFVITVTQMHSRSIGVMERAATLNYRTSHSQDFSQSQEYSDGGTNLPICLGPQTC